MTPETTTQTPIFTPQRRILSLARHWIDTGRAGYIAATVQLLLESNDPSLLAQAHALLGLLIEARQTAKGPDL